jgi:hypothetical protein
MDCISWNSDQNILLTCIINHDDPTVRWLTVIY